jgi:hypothetical protein
MLKEAMAMFDKNDPMTYTQDMERRRTLGSVFLQLDKRQ